MSVTSRGHGLSTQQNRIKWIAYLVSALVMLSTIGLMSGAVAAADTSETTVTVDGVNTTTISNASSANLTVDVEELDADHSRVHQYDADNGSSKLNTTLGNQTVTSTVTWTASDDEVTVDLTDSADWPPGVSGDSVDVFIDESVTELTFDDETVYPVGIGLLGGGIGSGDNQLLYIVGIVLVGYLLIRD